MTLPIWTASSPVAKAHYIGMLRLKPPGLMPMPVTLDLLARSPHSEFAENDARDLSRLAQDMGAWPCYQANWAAFQAGQSTVKLYVARFNARIVGAAFVEGDSLLSMGVRGLTRGRGVGRRMVTVLAQQCSLRSSARMHQELAAFVSACLASLEDRK